MSTLLLVLIASWACVLVPTVQDSCPAPSNVSRMNSYLWSVSRHPPAYLFGTIHVPYTRVWDYVALNAKHAFSSSERVYLELDLSDPHTVSELGRCQLLPRGQSLPSLLPRELYLRLKRHLAYVRRRLLGWGSREGGSRRRDPLLVSLSGGEWRRKRPIWLLLLLPWLSEAALRASAREGGGGGGSHSPPLLDVHLAREAARARKHLGAVELVHEQCAPLNRLSTAQVVFALNQSLSQHESVRGLWEARGGVGGPWEEPPTPSTEQLIQHYNCGDLTAFVFGQNASQAGEEEVVEEDAQQQQQEEDVSAQTERYFRTELIQKRNERMGRRVAALLHAHPSSTLFFAFGAGHFLGKNSIIDVLRREGFHVTHTPASQPVGSNEDLDPDFFRGIPKSSSEWNGQEHSSAIRDPFLLSWAPPGPPPAPLGPSFQPARAPGGGKISSGAGGHRQETASRRPQRQHHQHRHHRQQDHQRQQQHRREKKRRRQQQQLLRKKQQRKFSDLWVRLYDSTASPPPGMLAALPSDEPPPPASPLTPRGHCTARHRGGAHGAAPPTPAVVVAASRSLPDQRVRTLGLLASTSLPLAWTLLLY